MPGKRSIVVLTATDWHQPWWMSRQQLMSRLADRGWPVVYSNGPFSTWDRGSKRWQDASMLGSTERFPCKGGGHVLLEHSPRLLTTWPRSGLLSCVVCGAYAARLRRLARRYGNAAPIVFLNAPGLVSVAEKVSPQGIVLYVNDQWRRLSGWTAEADTQLERAVARSSLIVSVAETMAEDLPGDGPGRSRILPHGVDVGAFTGSAHAPCPEDLASIPRPRLGYVGRISNKVDFELIDAIAGQRPDWHWVLIGAAGVGVEENTPQAARLEALRARPNVHFLGVRDRSIVPAYLGHMDVNTICFKTTSDGFWGGTSPTKLWEYFATGIPIVSTPLATVTPWRDLVAIAATAPEWVAAIEAHLAGPDPGLRERRQRVAAENSWDHRTDQLEHWLVEV